MAPSSALETGVRTAARHRIWGLRPQKSSDGASRTESRQPGYDGAGGDERPQTWNGECTDSDL